MSKSKGQVFVGAVFGGSVLDTDEPVRYVVMAVPGERAAVLSQDWQALRSPTFGAATTDRETATAMFQEEVGSDPGAGVALVSVAGGLRDKEGTERTHFLTGAVLAVACLPLLSPTGRPDVAADLWKLKRSLEQVWGSIVPNYGSATDGEDQAGEEEQ